MPYCKERLECRYFDPAGCDASVGTGCFSEAEAAESPPDQAVSDGVWFRSAMSGELYRDRVTAGDIDCVYVGGIPFGKLG